MLLLFFKLGAHAKAVTDLIFSCLVKVTLQKLVCNYCELIKAGLAGLCRSVKLYQSHAMAEHRQTCAVCREESGEGTATEATNGDKSFGLLLHCGDLANVQPHPRTFCEVGLSSLVSK